MLVMFR